jgi:dihydrofolate reductase
VKIALIAAIAQNRVIGNRGSMPWHIPADLKRFKALTLGHPIVMGRKTFESIGRPLPGRRNIVISSQGVAGVECYTSFDAALQILKDEVRIFVIGGGKLYASALPRADELYLTFVHSTPDGDTLFPPLEHLLESRFRLVHSEDLEGFSFRDYVTASADSGAKGHS